MRPTPPTLEQEPNWRCRRHWWARVPVDKLPENPPTPEQEPDMFCRRKWWARVPATRLPTKPPTPEKEPNALCRSEWWERAPVDMLPTTPPTPEQEPISFCRRRWWGRILVEMLPTTPPTPEQEPANSCRRQWWERIPVEMLPPAPPTPEQERPWECRRQWWRRIPVEMLPPIPPTPEQERHWECRRQWWLRTQTSTMTIQDYLALFDVPIVNGHAVMYRKGRGGRNGVYYDDGATVEAPDWDPNPARECGGGLHVCPLPEFCHRFQVKGPILRLEIDVNAPCVISPHGRSPEKFRVQRVRVLGEFGKEDIEKMSTLNHTATWTVGTLAEMLVCQIRDRTTALGAFLDLMQDKFGPFEDEDIKREFRCADKAVDGLELLADMLEPLGARSFRERMERGRLLETSRQERLDVVDSEVRQGRLHD